MNNRRPSVVVPPARVGLVAIAAGLALLASACGQKGPLIGPRPGAVPIDAGASAPSPTTIVTPHR